MLGFSDVTDTGASKATVDVARTGASKEAVELGAVVLVCVGFGWATSVVDFRLELSDVVEDGTGVVVIELMVCDVAGTVRKGSPLKMNVFSGSNMVLSPGISGINAGSLLVDPAAVVLELAGKLMKPVFDERAVVGETVFDVTGGSLLGDAGIVDAIGGTVVVELCAGVVVPSSTGFVVVLEPG